MNVPDAIDIHKAPNRASVTTPGHGSYLVFIRELIRDFATKAGFPDVTVEQIVMAVDEACTNVVCHAYSPKKKWHRQYQQPQIRLDLTVEKNKLIVEINDHGQHFDLTGYHPESIDQRLKTMQTSGYGIGIMRQFMDEVVYSSNDTTGNTLRLVKNLQKA